MEEAFDTAQGIKEFVGIAVLCGIRDFCVEVLSRICYIQQPSKVCLQ